MSIVIPTFEPATPILRIFDVALAKEFYCYFLGMTLDWEHRYEPDLPLYMQVSLGRLRLHLSEHYGDGTPGTAVYIEGGPLRPFVELLLAKRAKFARPSPGDDDLTLTDPFGNKLRFSAK